jgi:hypothetical protein
MEGRGAVPKISNVVNVDVDVDELCEGLLHAFPTMIRHDRSRTQAHVR